MKIAILTLPFNNNYGGILQCYALQHFLKKEGHDVYVINNHLGENNCRDIRSKLFELARIFTGRRFLKNRKCATFTRFKKQHLKLTQTVKSQQDLLSLSKYGFDTIIVGSDQVWRFDYTRGDYASYFLDFTDGWPIKRFSFAASFGIDSWNLDRAKTIELSNLLKKFDGVSVREKSGTNLCNEHLGYSQAIQLLDPTFLLQPEDYKKLYTTSSKITNLPNRNRKTIVAYILDFNERIENYIMEIGKTMDADIVYIGQDRNTGVYQEIGDWLKSIDEADVVVTDSFHGTVFSIIYQKPFVLLMNEGRGNARFISLAETFHFSCHFDISKNFIHDDINIIAPTLISKIINNNYSICKQFIM